MMKIIIGIDLGGTNLRIGAVDEENKMLESVVIESEFLKFSKDPIAAFGDAIQAFAADYDLDDIEAISIGVPSSVGNDKETVICTTNIRDKEDQPVFQNTNIAKSLSERFQVPVFVNNDTNNILRYDVYRAKLKEHSVNIGIYIGTGVGASVLINGRSFIGANGVALDLGHIPYYKGEDICSCGKKGCCECYASGWKLEQIKETHFPDTDISDVFIEKGDTEPIKEFIHSIGHVVAIMATIFNPNVIVLGGGVVEMKGFPKAMLEAQVAENTGKDVMSFGFDYVYSTSSHSKGVIGAALFARKILQEGNIV